MKFLMYCGREHHFHKMKSVLDGLLDQGHEVTLMYSTNSVNVDPSFVYVSKYPQYHWVHAYEYLDGDAIVRAISAKREAIVTKAVYHTIPLIYWQSQHEANLLRESAKKALEGVDGLLILHGNNFFARIIASVADKVKVFAFQEGVLRKRDQETMNKQGTAADNVDTLFVWDKESRSQYIQAGIPKQKVKVVGMSHLDPYLSLDRSEVKASLGLSPESSVVLFAPPTRNEYVGNLDEDIRRLNSWCLTNGWILIVKLHPFDPVPTSPNISINYSTEDIYHLVVASDAVVTQGSTIGREAIAMGKSVFTAAFSGIHPEANDGRLAIGTEAVTIIAPTRKAQAGATEKILKEIAS